MFVSYILARRGQGGIRKAVTAFNKRSSFCAVIFVSQQFRVISVRVSIMCAQLQNLLTYYKNTRRKHKCKNIKSSWLTQNDVGSLAEAFPVSVWCLACWYVMSDVHVKTSSRGVKHKA